MILQLPVGSTHIKISQPILQLVGGAKTTPTGSKMKAFATPSAGPYYLVSSNVPCQRIQCNQVTSATAT